MPSEQFFFYLCHGHNSFILMTCWEYLFCTGTRPILGFL